MGFWSDTGIILRAIGARYQNAVSVDAWRLLRPYRGRWMDLRPFHACTDLVSTLKGLDSGDYVPWRGADHRIYVEHEGRLHRAYTLEFLVAILDPTTILALPYPETLPHAPPTLARRSRGRRKA